MTLSAARKSLSSRLVGDLALSSVLYISGLYYDLEQEHERAAAGDSASAPLTPVSNASVGVDSGYEFFDDESDDPAVDVPTGNTSGTGDLLAVTPPGPGSLAGGLQSLDVGSTLADARLNADEGQLRQLHDLLSYRVAVKHSVELDVGFNPHPSLEITTNSRSLNRSLALQASLNRSAALGPPGAEEADAAAQVELSAVELGRVRDVLQLPASDPILAEFEASLVTPAGPLDGSVVLTDRLLCFYDASVLTSKRFRLESYFEYEGQLTWRRRWLVLTNDTLQVFRRQKEHLPERTIRLADVVDIQMMQSYKHKANCLLVETPSKSHVFRADNCNQQQLWFRVLQSSISIARHVVRLPLANVLHVRLEPDLLVLPNAMSITSPDRQVMFCNFTRTRLAFDTISKAVAAAAAAGSALQAPAALGAPNDDPVDSGSRPDDSPPLTPRGSADLGEESSSSGSASLADSASGTGPPAGHHDSDDVRAEFDRRFDLKNDKLLHVYRCSLQRSLPLAGLLYVTDRHLCFYARLMTHRRQVEIPWQAISEIKLDTTLWLIPSAIAVKLGRHQDVVFFNFAPGSRARAFRQMREQWQQAQKIPQPLSPRVSLSDSDNRPDVPVCPRRLKITMLTIGSRGDVQPYLALGLGLQKAGHTVTIATHDAFRGFVTQYGLGFANIGGDPRLLIELSVNNGMFTPKFLKVALAQFRGLIDELFKNSMTACQGCDAIIASPISMASYHVAEALGVPLFLTFTMPWTRNRTYPHPFVVPETPFGAGYNYMTYRMIETVFWQPLRGQANAYRQLWGLPPIPLTNGDPLVQKRVPFLYCFSPSVVPKPPDWGDEIDVSGFWFLDAPSEWKPSKELLDFINSGSEPLIYVGFGSIIVEDRDKLTNMVFTAIQRAGVRCILVKGWGGLGSIQVPSNVFLIDSIPHDWLFPKVEAVVHHGGAGTIAAGLRFGVPTVVVSFFGDQTFWGQRLRDLGVGAYVHSKALTTDKLTAAIKSAVYDEPVRRNAVALGQALREEDGVGRAVSAFHRYLDNAYVPPALRPKWSSSSCHHCHEAFGHGARLNCRHCGHVFCAKHCHTLRPLPKFFIETPVPVCNACVAKFDMQ